MKCGGSAWCWSNIKVPKKRDKNCGLAGGMLVVVSSPPFADVAGKKATWKRRSAPNVRYTHQPARTRKNKDKNNHIPPLFSDLASFFSFV